MAIYKRHSVWWADFVVNGQRYRQSLETGDRREALNEEKALIAKASDGKPALPGTRFVRLSLSDAIEQYIADRKPRLARKTIQTESERAKIVKAKLGNQMLKRISAETVLAYMRDRSESGVSNGTVNRELDIIRGVLRRAKRWAAMAEDVRPFPVRKNVGRVLTYEEKVKLIRTAKERPEWQSMRLAMTLALNTTMRSSEIRTLRWRDINLFDKSLTVGRSKTDADERVIPLNEGALAAVHELRDRAKLLFGEAIEPAWYLFPWNADQVEPDPLRPVGSWRRAWRNLTRSIRCPECRQLQKPGKRCWQFKCAADISKIKSATAGFRFHDLRHQAITELSEGGASDATIMGIAGHVSRKMLEHYSHARTAAKRAALDGLGGRHSTVTAQQESFVFLGESQVIENVGGREGIRTPGLLVANEALSQLSYSPTSSREILADAMRLANRRCGVADVLPCNLRLVGGDAGALGYDFACVLV